MKIISLKTSLSVALITSLLITPIAQVKAASSHRIAAIVNDNIISELELKDRIKMVITTTGMQNSPEAQKQLTPQIIRSLIDERLQIQEASNNGLTISEEEINQAIATLEQQRQKESGSLLTYLSNNGVHPKTFKEQLRAQIAWNKIISRKIASQVTIGDDELNNEINYLRHANQTAEQLLLSGILLPITNPEDTPKIKELANRLHNEINQGASFEAISTQLSGANALTNPMTWVPTKQLDPIIANALANLENKAITQPIMTPQGIQIVKLHDRRTINNERDAEVQFKQLILSLEREAQQQEVGILMNIAKAVAKHPGTCKEKNVAGINDFEGLNIDVSYPRMLLSTMSPDIRPLVQNLEVEQISEPFAAPDGIHLLMLCEKAILPLPTPNKDAIRQKLFSKKLELEALKHLRDLRRKAFIDVKI